MWQCAGEAAGVQRRYANFIVRVGLFPVAVAGGCPAQRIIPRDADQYNAIQERLISRFSELYSREPFYFCCCQDTDEDRSTVLYLQDCAQQAGQESRFIYIEDLGLGVGGVLTDLDDNVIQRAFKLYPLEWMMRDDNGPLLRKRLSNGWSRYGKVS